MAIERLYTIDENLIFEHECGSQRECLEEAVRQDVDLTDVNLHGEDLRGAQIPGAHMPGANLRWAILHEANLWGVNLRGANLEEIYAFQADFRDADLTGALFANPAGPNPMPSLYQSRVNGAVFSCSMDELEALGIQNPWVAVFGPTPA